MLLVLTIALLIACNGETTTAVTTTEPPVTTEAPTLPEGERVVKSNYTAVLNDEEWNPGSVNASDYDIFGTGSEIYSTIKSEYKAYTTSYVIVKDGTETAYTAVQIFSALKDVGVCGAKMTIDETAKTATAKIYPVECVVQSAWKAVTAQAGTYIRFDFAASIPLDFVVTVTPEESGAYSTSVYTQDGITTTSDGVKAVGKGQATVPSAPGTTYYINICIDTAGYPVLESFPLNVVASKYDSPYRLVFQGDWTYLNDESYFEKFIDLFYNVYPRLNARWGGTGKEPQTITVKGRLDYSGVAYASGSTIGYSINYLNNGSNRIGSLSHELTHLVQKYHYQYGTDDDASNNPDHWFTENMANYGRHRYWAYGYCTDFIEEKDPQKSKDWNYSEYGNSQLFFSWMDWMYPSKDLDGDGKVTTMEERGLLDYLVYMSKEWTGDNIDDDPYVVGSVFNNWVKDKTGYLTLDLLRQEFARQIDAGEWTFAGFRDYPDNFVTENIAGIPNPDYPMHEELQPTAKTNPVLAAAVTTGNNLCATATIYKAASEPTGDTYSASKLIDGDLETRYQASRATNLYNLNKICNEIIIDLGAIKTFDTYTLVCYNNRDAYIAKAWEILVSDDGATFTAIDYQKDNTEATVSVTFDEVSARYVKIRMFEPDATSGITRLCEFMLFDL